MPPVSNITGLVSVELPLSMCIEARPVAACVPDLFIVKVTTICTIGMLSRKVSRIKACTEMELCKRERRCWMQSRASTRLRAEFDP